MITDDLKEIERLARMQHPPTDNSIKIAQIAARALNDLQFPQPEPEVRLESIEYKPPEPEPLVQYDEVSDLDLESIRRKLQTNEKVGLPPKPPMIHDLLEKTDQERAVDAMVGEVILDAALAADAAILKGSVTPEPELLGDDVEIYDPSIPLEIAMDDDSVDGIGDGEIVFDPNKLDARDA
jgi:hypothetical protein